MPYTLIYFILKKILTLAILPLILKKSWYDHVRKQLVKSRINKMLNQGIIQLCV